MNKIIYFVLGAVLVTAINIGMSRYMLNNQYDAIQAQINVPKIVVVDEGLLNIELKTQPDGSATSPAQLLADRENLFTALRLQNYVVVSNFNLLTYPVTSELKNVKMDEVRAWLKKNDAPFSTKSDHAETIRMAEQLLKQQFTLPNR